MLCDLLHRLVIKICLLSLQKLYFLSVFTNSFSGTSSTPEVSDGRRLLHGGLVGHHHYQAGPSVQFGPEELQVGGRRQKDESLHSRVHARPHLDPSPWQVRTAGQVDHSRRRRSHLLLPQGSGRSDPCHQHHLPGIQRLNFFYLKIVGI